jgi:hypothetical protein
MSNKKSSSKTLSPVSKEQVARNLKELMALGRKTAKPARRAVTRATVH